MHSLLVSIIFFYYIFFISKMLKYFFQAEKRRKIAIDERYESTVENYMFYFFR